MISVLDENNIQNNIFASYKDDVYELEIDGKKEIWYCTIWYDRPLIWENEEKTKILIFKNWTNQVEIFDLFKLSFDECFKIVQKSKSSKNYEKKQDDTTTDVLIKAGYTPKTYYCTYKDWGKLYSFNKNELIELRPELFI